MESNTVQQLVLSSTYTADLHVWVLCALVCLFNIYVAMVARKVYNEHQPLKNKLTFKRRAIG